jgi:hypothetical protein
MKKHVITSKTVKMATPLETNPEFTHFTNYMGVQLTMTNLQIYADLFRNFVEWPSPNLTYSFAEKFISWKRFYDEYKETQEQIINTNLFATPPTDPRTLKNVNASLPQDLQQLNTDTFHHFILENNPQPTQTPTDSCTDCTKDLSSPFIMDDNTLRDIASQHTEIIEEVLQQSNPTQAILPNDPSSVKCSVAVVAPIAPLEPLIMASKDIISKDSFIPSTSNPTPLKPQILPEPYEHTIQSITIPTIYRPNQPIPTQGKNITQMKAIYKGKKSRKRKVSPQDDNETPFIPTVIVGPGRPSKNDSLLRDAQNEEKSPDDELMYAFREVHLLSSNGTMRKKTRLLTKQSDRDLRCFAIKHFASLEYIAEKKRKSFGIIKKERQKIKTLNYLELNTITDMKEIQ